MTSVSTLMTISNRVWHRHPAGGRTNSKPVPNGKLRSVRVATTGMLLSMFGIGVLSVVAGCETGRTGSLTPGAAKKHIQPGVTTQAEVVEVFGTPNIITQKDGHEMWVYDKVSSRQTNAAFGLGGLGGGAGSGAAGGGGIGFAASSTERSETTVMLIVYFGEHDVVSDYRISQTKF